MVLTIALETETDGRIIASVPELPGVHVYGATRAEAERNALALAFRVLADEVENGERDASALAPLTIATAA